MGTVHKPAKVIGLAVKPCRSERLHAIISPSKPPGKFSDGHDFQYGDARFNQVRKFEQRRFPNAFSCKGADMHLINDLPPRSNTGPAFICPLEFNRIDYLGPMVRTLVLKTGGRVGVFSLLIETILI